ncbi:MAG: hypothetical protein ABUL72_02990, partial [Armatimonadota bacterium]
QFETLDKLKSALQNGSLSQQAVDESVKRIFRTIIRVGLLDSPPQPNASLVNSKEHKALAKEAAEKGIVLLKNEGGLLPLDHAAIDPSGLLHNHCSAQRKSPGVATPGLLVCIMEICRQISNPAINRNCLAGAAANRCAAKANVAAATVFAALLAAIAAGLQGSAALLVAAGATDAAAVGSVLAFAMTIGKCALAALDAVLRAAAAAAAVTQHAAQVL